MKDRVLFSVPKGSMVFPSQMFLSQIQHLKSEGKDHPNIGNYTPIGSQTSIETNRIFPGVIIEKNNHYITILGPGGYIKLSPTTIVSM